jgi:hypothetical protein
VYADPAESWPVHTRLYLPKEWTGDPARCAQVRISVKVATCFGLKVATHRSVATRAFKLTKSGNFASSFSDISGLFSAF